MKRVAFGALGGTISMTPDDSGGIVPTLGADDLAASLGRAAGVKIIPTTLRTVPSASLSWSDLHDTLAWAREQVDAGADGVVVSQGTDTLEETSWLLHLAWDRPQPLVLTGAMRGAQAPGADGPANLVDALVTAASPGARGRGALVVMAGETHAAAWVRKEHSSHVTAFASPGVGLAGAVVEGRAQWFTAATPRPGAVAIPEDARLDDPWVPLVTTTLGDDGRLARTAVDAGAAALVVAATGVGHVSEAASDVLAELAGRVPVVLATRTFAGRVHAHTYGYPGAEIDLLGRGLVSAGWLNPLKARLLVWALLASGVDAAGLPEALASHIDLPS